MLNIFLIYNTIIFGKLFKYAHIERGVFVKVNVDRAEEGFFVCITDDGDVINIPKEDFPFEVHECDVLDITLSDGRLTEARFLADETEAQKQRAKSVMDRLRSKFKNK